MKVGLVSPYDWHTPGGVNNHVAALAQHGSANDSLRSIYVWGVVSKVAIIVLSTWLQAAVVVRSDGSLSDEALKSAITKSFSGQKIEVLIRAEITAESQSSLQKGIGSFTTFLTIFAGIAVFLASTASDFVTGTAIPVDGGYSIQG